MKSVIRHIKAILNNLIEMITSIFLIAIHTLLILFCLKLYGTVFIFIILSPDNETEIKG